MIYLFKRDPDSNTGVYIFNVNSHNDLRKEMQKHAAHVLFIYNDDESSIEVVNEYYDAIECTYFIYKHLGIFKSLSEIQLKYTASTRMCTQK